MPRHGPEPAMPSSTAFPALLALALFALAPSASAAPATLRAAGIMRTAAGGPVPDGSYVLVAALYSAADAKQGVYLELHNKVAVKAGAFGLLIGADGKLDSSVLTGDQPLWLGVQIGGGDELPRVRIDRMARAWHAKEADHAKAADHAKLADKSKAADIAKLAETADTAKEADHAKKADVASNASAAQNAETAVVAKSALGLSCTGCIGPAQLSKEVAGAFLSTKGGKVAGRLEVGGGLDLLGGTLANARLEVVDVAASKCDAKALGRVVLGAKGRVPWLCNGSAFVRLRTCTGACRAAGQVPCGQAIPNDCGDVIGCSGRGSLCASGTCKTGKCSARGSSQDDPATSCKAIHAADLTAKTGLYWLDPDGKGGGAAFRAWCDMSTAGGGWTLAINTKNTTAWAAGAAIWHNTSVASSPATPTHPGKSPAYLRVVGDQLLFKTHGEAAGYWASFRMPASSTLLDMVGTTNIGSAGNGYKTSITHLSAGPKALACWKQTWRVRWRNYWSSDNYPDSSLFAPSGAASGRPCGGDKAYATGIGVRTDTNNGFGGYGGSFEGYGSDGAGNKALTGGYAAIYVR